ncbi:MAG: MFS transporter, partial [Chloroflexi bacterium]|nr:MFS transporter [Chloroflexota bacterium]
MDKQTIWVTRLIILVSFLDLFAQFPVVAPYAHDLGASASLIGIIVGAYSATNLIGNMVAGVMLDRWKRKALVLAGLLTTAGALASYPLARTPEHLLTIRIVHGLAAAVLTPGAFAIIGDLAGIDRRARAMGVSGAVITVAAIVGPPVSGIVRDRVGIGGVFLGGAALMCIAATAFGLLARDTRTRTIEATPLPTSPTPEHPTASYLALWTRSPLATAYLAALALTVGLGTLVTHLPLTLAARGEPASRIGLAFTVYAIVAMVGMAGPLSQLSDRHGRVGPVAAGLVVIGGGLTLLSLAETAAGIAAGMAVFGFGFGLLFPAATALVTDATARNERGAAFGIFYAVYSLGVVIGSVLSGI